MRIRNLVVTLALPCALSSAAPVQWTVESGGNGHWYEAVFVGPFTTWDTANALAMGSGGHLVTISSETENDFVYSLIENRPDLWTLSLINNGLGPWMGGFQDPGGTEPGQGWQWVTAEPMDYTNWGPGEPSEGELGTSDYMHYFGAASPTGSVWNDTAQVDWDIRGYVVEYVPSPSSAGLAIVGALTLVQRQRRRVARLACQAGFV